MQYHTGHNIQHNLPFLVPSVGQDFVRSNIIRKLYLKSVTNRVLYQWAYYYMQFLKHAISGKFSIDNSPFTKVMLHRVKCCIVIANQAECVHRWDAPPILSECMVRSI